MVGFCGEGVDVAYSGGRSSVLKQVSAMGHDAAADLKSKGYTFVDSVEALKTVAADKTKVVMLDDEADMPIRPTVMDAIARLSQNPKGFVLVVFSDCHTGKTASSLRRIVEMAVSYTHLTLPTIYSV